MKKKLLIVIGFVLCFGNISETFGMTKKVTFTLPPLALSEKEVGNKVFDINQRYEEKKFDSITPGDIGFLKKVYNNNDYSKITQLFAENLYNNIIKKKEEISFAKKARINNNAWKKKMEELGTQAEKIMRLSIPQVSPFGNGGVNLLEVEIVVDWMRTFLYEIGQFWTPETIEVDGDDFHRNNVIRFVFKLVNFFSYAEQNYTNVNVKAQVTNLLNSVNEDNQRTYRDLLLAYVRYITANKSQSFDEIFRQIDQGGPLHEYVFLKIMKGFFKRLGVTLMGLYGCRFA